LKLAERLQGQGLFPHNNFMTDMEEEVVVAVVVVKILPALRMGRFV
jgi:hypothetical protein